MSRLTVARECERQIIAGTADKRALFHGSIVGGGLAFAVGGKDTGPAPLRAGSGKFSNIGEDGLSFVFLFLLS